MVASLFDSPIWRDVLYDKSIATLFTDTAVLRAELLVMGSLALTQAKAGIVPEVSAKAIQRAAMEVQVDPGALSRLTAETGHPVLALSHAFRDEMKAPEHAKWVHHESDPRLTAATGLALRLRQVLGHFEKRLTVESPPHDGILQTTPLVIRAYHGDPALRAGLAKGLGLGDGGSGATPHHAMVYLAQWAETTAETMVPATPTHEAIAAIVTQLCQPLFTEYGPEADAMIAGFALPQICMGLSILIPAATTLAN